MEGSNKVKGKRTKRQRHYLLPPLVSSVLSPTTYANIYDNLTEEEKDVATFLMFLARGAYNQKPDEIEEATTAVNIKSCQQFAVPTTTSSEAGNNAHQCRDCNMCFLSYQALGGHRASHNKKLKPSFLTSSKVMNVNSIQSNINSFSSPPTIKERIHKCNICGLEFKSGQALGGHKRKHYSPITPEPTKMEEKKEERKEEGSKSFFLDLNIAPPCDD